MGKQIFKSWKHRVPYRINPRRKTPRHIFIKLTKIKGQREILKATKGKQQVTYKGIPIWLSSDFSAETLQLERTGMIYLK